MQSIDSIKIYAYKTSKKVASKKEETKCGNIIRQYKKRLTLIMFKNHKRK